MNIRTACLRTPARLGLAVLTSALALCAGGGASAGDGAGSLSSQMTTAPLTDPSLNDMVAVHLNIPQGWKVQGITTKLPCTPLPLPAFRAQSADGFMEMRQEPLMGWNWVVGNKNTAEGCAKYTGVVAAADFIQFFLQTLDNNVHVVGAAPVPKGFAQWAQQKADQGEQNNSRVGPMFAMKYTADSAALRVQVFKGKYLVEQRLLAAVVCGVKTASKPTSMGTLSGGRWQGASWDWSGGNCYARLVVLTAPKGKLDALVQLADAHDLPAWKAAPEWQQKVFQQMVQKNDATGHYWIVAGQQESRNFSNLMRNTFEQNMARSRSEHEAFMQQQERSFQSSMNAANTAMNARSTATSDWVDYALNRQTVSGVNGTYKTSDTYSSVWSSPYGPANSDGRTFGTTDNTLDPNSATDSSWTKDQKVHGNGQPY